MLLIIDRKCTDEFIQKWLITFQLFLTFPSQQCLIQELLEKFPTHPYKQSNKIASSKNPEMHQDFNSQPPSQNPPFQNFPSSPFFQELSETSLKKQLIIQCASFSYSEQFSVSIPYDYERRELDLGYVVTEIFTKVLHLEGSVQVFCYSARSESYTYVGVYPFVERVFLGKEYIQQSVITVMFRYFGMELSSFQGESQNSHQVHQNLAHRQSQNEGKNTFESSGADESKNSHSEMHVSSLIFSQIQQFSMPKPMPVGIGLLYNEEPQPSIPAKKKRVKDRSIRDALQKVAEWRNLHQESYNPKMNLEEAAKIVQIPKKTLDDYYFQVKIGEEFGFDFQENLDNKIGVLRKFVKEKRGTSNQRKLKNLISEANRVKNEENSGQVREGITHNKNENDSEDDEEPEDHQAFWVKMEEEDDEEQEQEEEQE